MLARGVVLARTADGLTAARFALGPVLAVAIAAHRLATAALLLSLAWITDALDGRMARAANRPTALHAADLAADTVVGAGVLAGLGLAGAAPPWLVVGLLGVFGLVFVRTGNHAASFALQGAGYGWFLWSLWQTGDPIRWTPLVVVAVLFAADYRRLFTDLIPAFFHGVAELLSHWRPSRP